MEHRTVSAEAVVSQIWIQALPETIFPFLVDPTKMTRWMGIAVDLEPHPGGIYRVEINERDIARGEFVEIQPPHRVVFTFGWEAEDASIASGASRVEIELTPSRGGTQVRLTHHGLPAESRAAHLEGWDHYVVRLRTVAEGNDPGPDPWAERGEEAGSES